MREPKYSDILEIKFGMLALSEQAAHLNNLFSSDAVRHNLIHAPNSPLKEII